MRQIFLRQLPEDVRVQVTALNADTLSALARKADVIMSAKRSPSLVYASSRPVGKKSPPHRPEKTNLCWYHAKFGHKTKACRPPCAYSPPTGEHCPPSGNGQART